MPLANLADNFKMPQPADNLCLSAKALRTEEQPISFLMAAAVQGGPDLISLAAGLIDPETLPIDDVRAACDRLLTPGPRGKETLQYGTTHGLRRLRAKVVEHVCRLDGTTCDDLSLTPDNVIVTTGSQQSLYLLAETLLDVGDIVIAADPSYFVYTGTLASFGAKVLTVPMDAGGMSMDALEHLLQQLERDGRLPRVKFIYCQSYYQNPTGLTLAEDRRPRLVELARRFSTHHRLLVLEDAAYRELGYDAPPPPSVKRYDPQNLYVATTFTFSKPFSAGLKTGYAILPDDLVDPVLQQKGNHDFGSPNLCQQIVDEALETGVYARHLDGLKKAYKAKRDAMLAALEKHMPAEAYWTKPGGGLYVWLTLPEGTDTGRHGPMFAECLRAGVMYVPGAFCHQPDGSGHRPGNSCRLSFGVVPLERIELGIERLAGVIKAQLAERTTTRKAV
ncbi:MAG: PLP-dependent aminotransferase family protein [Phycisphaerae bacterium]